MGYYPDIELLISTRDHEKLLEFRRSYRSLIPLSLLFAASSAAVYIAGLYMVGGEDGRLPSWGFTSLRWIGLIPHTILLEIFRKRYNDLYVLGLHTAIRYAGRLSFRYSVPAVKYVDVKGIIVSQGIWGRLFDYGSVLLGTAAQDSSELVIEGVRAPEELARLIEQLRVLSARIQEQEKEARQVGRSQKTSGAQKLR